MVKKSVNKSEFARLAGVSAAAVTKAAKGPLLAAMDGKRVDVAHPVAVEYLAKQDRAQTPPPATGVDPLYEEAVETCERTGRYSASNLQRELKIGYTRATRIVATMKAAGVTSHKNAPPDKREQSQPAPRAISGRQAANETKKRQPPPPQDQIFEVPEDIQTFAEMTLRELVERFGTDNRFLDWLNATQKIEAINEKRLKNAQTKGTLISRELVKHSVIDTFNAAHLRLMKDGAKSIAAGVVSKHSGGAELSEVEAFVSDILGSFIKPIKSKITRVLKDA